MKNPENRTEVFRSQHILRLTFGLVPIAAGADKFFSLLADWEEYLHPMFAEIMPASTFMIIVGVIEIAAGIIVLARPRVGSMIVAAWLLAIALNLILTGDHLDVAVRDITMAISAFVLSKLTLATEDRASKDRGT